MDFRQSYSKAAQVNQSYLLGDFAAKGKAGTPEHRNRNSYTKSVTCRQTTEPFEISCGTFSHCSPGAWLRRNGTPYVL